MKSNDQGEKSNAQKVTFATPLTHTAIKQLKMTYTHLHKHIHNTHTHT